MVFDNIHKILGHTQEKKKLKKNIKLILQKLPKVKILIASRTELDTIAPFKEVKVEIKGLEVDEAIKLFES
jgi:hypothetical protein